MKKVEFKIDENSEMLEISIEGSEWCFMGNFWDFSRPGDIIDFAKALDAEVEVKYKNSEEE